jgi:hypothetical protein
MRLARRRLIGCALFLLVATGFAQVSRQELRAPAGARLPAPPESREVGFRAGSASSDEQASPTPFFGAIGTVGAGTPASPQQVFGRRSDVYLAGGPAGTPCRFTDYISDGKYYFQVTDPSGTLLFSTDPVSERAVTVKGGVISSYNGTTHATDGKTACGSLAVGLMPFADAGSQKAAYVVWLTAASNFDGSTTAVDSVCGAGCFHGFHADLSRAYAFRVEDKKSCEPTFCVSGVKFNDANGNGVQDAGEAGLPGVEIRVTSEKGSVLSGLTGADGSYRICGLTDDVAFRVTETLPFGYSQTGPLDRDISRRVHARGSAFIIDLCDADIAGLDFGNKLIPNAIGGFKFEDLNANGARDPGEPPLAGVTILLTPAGGGTARTTVTDASGNFLFTDVAPGSYVLTEIVPAGFSQTMPATDGIPVTLASGGTSIGNVFGNFHGILTGTIFGLKFNDLNGNGVRDPGEPGVAGVQIVLSACPSPCVIPPVAGTVTGADGSFSFTAIPFGTYFVSETVPLGFQQTTPSTKEIQVLLDFGHQAVSGLLFGNRALGSIAGTKFNDANGNGARDAGEAGVSGVTIQLRNAAGQVSSTTTDTSGNFSFTGLGAGSYVLSEVVPAGSVQTLPGGGAGINITLTSGQNATGFLFGNQVAAPASIAGAKFNDANGNGVRDTGEPGLPGVSIQLKTPSGQTLAATSDASGAFSFTGLAAGTYLLSEIVPAGFTQTAPPAPGTISVTLTAGQNATGFLFGNRAIQAGGTSLISGIKYLDLDANGVVNGLDRPQPGIVFVLTDSNGVTRQTTSAADGTFSFASLPAGTYVLSEILPANFFQTFPGTPANPGTYTITLAPGQQATGFLFLNKC